MNIKISEKEIKTKIDEPRKLADILIKVLNTESEDDKNKEHFWGVYFNSRNIIQRIELISLGILNASMIHPRETFCPAIESHCAAIAVVHNHPSGDTEPSADDIAVTRRLEEAGKILGIELLDHLIITTDGKYLSFKEKELL